MGENMIGAVGGDIIGSIYEINPIKQTEFPLFGSYSKFTDDTVLTIAIAHSILENGKYVKSLKYFGRKYPNAGYGGKFYQWMMSDDYHPYYSWGNGSAMRVSSIGFAYNSIEQVMNEAKKSAEVTHNHPEGIKGAQAVALSILLARFNYTKEQIKEVISTAFNYNLNRSLDELRPSYYPDISCQGSVPESIIAFLESENYEDAIRKAISLGGDSDTMACITGGIAQAYYKEIPQLIISEIRKRLPEEFLLITDRFNTKFGV